MTTAKGLWTGLALLTLAALWTGMARADEVPSFKKVPDLADKDEARRFVSQVTVALLKAAHPTGVDPMLVNYEIRPDEPRAGRTQITIKAEYKGKLTKRR